jgi:hypothetical protein
VRDLIAAGVGEEDATRAVEQAAAQLRAIQEQVPEPPPVRTVVFNEVEHRLSDELVGLSIALPNASVIELRLSEDLVPDVVRTLGYLQAGGQDGDCRIIAFTSGATIEFHPPDKSMWHCEPRDFVATVKADILEQVLRLASYEVALHTAALVRNGSAILLAGPPGAGKSTLALALTQAGWELAADDVVLMNSAGRVIGLPFPITAKASSWPMLDQHWPQFASYPAYHRPDGFDVRYIVPKRIAPGPLEVGAFVVLDRRLEGGATLDEVEPDRMLGILISEGTSHDQRLTVAGFNALATALDGARCAKLTYCDLFEGVAALDELFR